MKRKIFSKLLMVALVIAAVGSFVSCKDYDDDINNLQKQIDNAALKSSVEALEKTLDSKITAAQNAAAAAQTAADKAAATANAAVTKAQLDDAISAAKSAAATAANEYADKVAAAAQTAAAKEAYDQAKKYVDDEVAKVTAAIPSEDAIKAIAAAAAAELDGKLATELKTWVNEQIDAIDVEGQVESAVAKAIEKIDTAAANVAAIWSAVTEVELVKPNDNLLFYQGKQAVTYTFGKETGDLAAAQYQEYTKGEDIIFRNNVLVRVNPVNATFDPADVKLVNSLGENLNGLVKIQKIEKYNQLITTRADETGLWMITFAREEAATDAQFAKATKGAEVNGTTLKTATGKALYAIAINNEQEAAAKRFVVSPYHFGISYGAYQNTNTLDFTVNNEAIADLHNRWDGKAEKVVAEDETKAQSPADYKWAASSTALPTPAAEIVLKPKANVVYDSRFGNKKYVFVKVDEPFEIAGINMNTIDYYYVVLDKDCAIESNPSEVRAWESYEYDGINTKVESGKPLQITVKSTGADPNGDIIGFRVFAVNYDGLLADPDGRAFYVQVGTPEVITPTVKTASAAFTPKVSVGTFGTTFNEAGSVYSLAAAIKGKVNNVVFACDFKDLGLANDITLAAAGFPTELTATTANNENDLAKNVKVYVNYLTSDQLTLTDQAQTATRVNQVAYVSLTVANPEDVVDKHSFTTNTFAVKDPDAHGKQIASIAFQLSKGEVVSVPAAYDPAQGGKAFSWKSDHQPDANGVVTVYPMPVTWNIAAALGNTDVTSVVDLHEYTNNLQGGAQVLDATLTYTAGDYNGWMKYSAAVEGSAKVPVEEQINNIWYRYTTGTTLGAGTFDGILAPMAGYITNQPAVGQPHNVLLTVETAGTGEQISRTYKPGKNKDAAANTYNPTAPTYTLFSNKLFFDDIMLYEEYSMNHTYVEGTVGQEVTKGVTKQNKLWLSWSKTAGATKLRQYYKSATDPGASGKFTVAGSDAYWATVADDGTNNGYLSSLAEILNVAKNSKIGTFGPKAFDPTYYLTTGIDLTNAYVESENGAKDEYIKIAPASTPTNIQFAKVGSNVPTKSMNLKLVVKCTDAFGKAKNLEIPFFLDLNN